MLLLVGFAVGPITGFLDPDELFGDVLLPIVSISVAVILFEGGLSLRFKELKKTGMTVGLLVTVGALLTWALIGGAAYYLLDMALGTAVVLGALLVVTGPTVIVPLLRHVQPTPRVAATLRWEGILIDPIGAMLAVLAFEVFLAPSLREQTATAALIMGETVLIAIVLAALGVGLLMLLFRYDWAPDYLQSPLTLAVVIAAFAASNVLQAESGLLTATLMGVALTNQKVVDIRHIIEFKENLGVLIISGLFILLAARLEIADMQTIGVTHLAFLAALIFIVRPLVVALCTIGSGLALRERLFLSWIAPRGIVAAAVASVFALELANAGYEDARLLVSISFFVIVGTVVVYGLTASPIARLLGVAQPDPQGLLIVGAQTWAREIARELGDEGVPVQLVDTNHANVAAARLAGLRAYDGNALSESVQDDIDLTGIGRLIALTANDEVNSLAALNFEEVFGERSIYQLAPARERRDGEGVPLHLRGYFLFDASASYATLSSRFARGADVKTTNITEEFVYEAFMATYPDAIPLFLIGPGDAGMHRGGPTARLERIGETARDSQIVGIGCAELVFGADGADVPVDLVAKPVGRAAQQEARVA